MTLAAADWTAVIRKGVTVAKCLLPENLLQYFSLCNCTGALWPQFPYRLSVGPILDPSFMTTGKGPLKKQNKQKTLYIYESS